MIQDTLQKKIIQNYNKINSWFEKKSQGRVFPFYSSFDLRDSALKISPVDANLFPAGFNNICTVDRAGAVHLCRAYLKKHFPLVKNFLLLAEEHTKNPFYWDNIYALKTLLEKSGGDRVLVCVPGHNIQQSFRVQSAQGHFLEVFLLKEKEQEGELIISNNDFSVDYGRQFKVPVTPPIFAGWNRRRKHSFFKEYNLLAEEFAQLIHIEKECINIKTKRFTQFDPQSPQSLKRLKAEVAQFLLELKTLYPYQQGHKKAPAQEPFVFLKNNAGTYGLGMTALFSPEDIDHWNYKIKKRMKASKGGNKVTELIIQEGIASHLHKEGAVAEPALYFIGPHLAGGFLRTHKEKGKRDNLNSPGAVYRPLCVSDLEIEIEGKHDENVYGYIARLGALAVLNELASTVT